MSPAGQSSEVDPMWLSIESALEEDEELTEQGNAAQEEARAEADRGEAVSHAEVQGELGR